MKLRYLAKRNFTVCNIVGVCATTKKEFVNLIFNLPEMEESAIVDFIGVPAVILAKENKELADMYNNCTIPAIDGMPIVKLARKSGCNAERCAAPDVMGMIFEEGIKRGSTHYFYGGKSQEVLDTLKNRLKEMYPGIEIVGSYNPPFRPLTSEEDKYVIDDIKRSKPDFIWVGIGCPKQELWMQSHQGRINNAIMLGVGAGFDFFAGSLDKAPEWIEKAGFEWAYRLYKEPKRLWKRYIIGGFKWIYYSRFEKD